MTLGELRTALRWRLDDSAAPYLWPDEELNSYINQAVDEACFRARLNIDSSSAAVTPVVVTAGVAEYALHSSIIDVLRVWDNVDNHKLIKTGFDELDQLYPSWPSHEGPLMKYVLDLNYYHATGDEDQTHRLTIYPKPAKDTTLSLTVYRLPLEPMASDGDVPEIPRQYHSDLLHWAAHLAYLKRDADTSDPNKARDAMQLFEIAFGEKPGAVILEHRRKYGARRVISRWK